MNAARARPPAAREPERIAVTGATGSLGARFVLEALRRWPGVRVAALVRPGSRSAASGPFAALRARHGARIEVVPGDLGDPDGLPAAAAQRAALCDADGGLWHFAACTVLSPRDAAARARLWEVNDRGTARLLALLAGRDAPGPLFHVSTAYVCGRRTGIVFEQPLDDGRGFRNDYEASKWAAERRVHAAFGRGLRGAVLRPGVVVDGAPSRAAGQPGSAKVVEQIGAAIAAAVQRREPELTLCVPATGAIHAVRGDWVAAALLALAGETDGCTFHLTARRPLVLTGLARAAARVAGLRVAFAPEAAAAALRGTSRAAERRLRPLAGYLAAGRFLCFDRGNLEQRAGAVAAAEDLGLDALIAARVGARGVLAGAQHDPAARPGARTRP